MQRKRKPLNPLASLVLLIGLVLLGIVFLLFALIGIIADPWGVLFGLLLGSVLYYVHYRG